MSNDADQKSKWRECTVTYATIGNPLFSESVDMIEAAPALAEIEKLKEALEMWTQRNAKLQAENAELKRRISGHIGAVDIFCERNDNLLAENANWKIKNDTLNWPKVEAELEKLRAANGVLWKTLDQIDWHIRGLQNEKILTMKEMGIALKVISDGLTGLKGILNDTTN